MSEISRLMSRTKSPRRSGDPQDAVMAARGHAHCLRRIAQQIQAGEPKGTKF
jgi:hypothetical protein